MAVPLFTIEQIELIRRLRNSGITKEQIILAFNQLDRLEAEFGKPNEIIRPSNPAVIVHNNTLIPQLERRQSESPLGLIISKPPPTSHTNGLTHPLRADQQHSPYKVTDYSRPQSNGNSTNGGTPLENSSLSNGELSPSASVTSPTSKLPSELTIIPISSSSSSSSEPPNNPPSDNGPLINSKPDHVPFRSEDSVVPVHCMVNPHDLLQDEIAELEELKKRGDMEILSEIRNFVMRYNIKQTMIAEMTKMSQAYVSRFFRGDIQDMSDRTKHTFYMWYLTCKNNPWKLTQLCPNSGVKRMVSESGDLIPLKRERFTFKASHLAVLERYYEKDPYPDAQTREQIVEECNRAVGQPLCHERDRVTLPVVNNWFNNRRKEAKKQLRQQHAAAMAAMSLTSLANTATPLQQALTWGQAAFPTNLSLGSSSGSACNSTMGAPEAMADSGDSSDSMVDEPPPPPPVKQEL